MAGAAQTEWCSRSRAHYPRFADAGQSVLAGTDDLLENRLLSENVLKVVTEERTELIIMRAARACDAAHRTL